MVGSIVQAFVVRHRQMGRVRLVFKMELLIGIVHSRKTRSRQRLLKEFLVRLTACWFRMVLLIHVLYGWDRFSRFALAFTQELTMILIIVTINGAINSLGKRINTWQSFRRVIVPLVAHVTCLMKALILFIFVVLAIPMLVVDRTLPLMRVIVNKAIINALILMEILFITSWTRARNRRIMALMRTLPLISMGTLLLGVCLVRFIVFSFPSTRDASLIILVPISLLILLTSKEASYIKQRVALIIAWITRHVSYNLFLPWTPRVIRVLMYKLLRIPLTEII